MAWDPNKKTLSQTLAAQGRTETGAEKPSFIPRATTPTAPTTQTPITPKPVATTPAPVTPTVPVAPVTTTPTPSTTTPQSTPTTGGMLNKEKLIASGVDPTAVDEVMAKLSPYIAGQKQVLATEEAKKDFIIKDVEEEQKKTEELYSKVKQEQTLLTQEQQRIVDESAKTSQEALAQATARERALLEEGKRKYETEQAINLRDTQREQRDLEQKLARSMSASMGSAFSFSGMQQVADIEQKGIDIISNLKSQTAYGMAEFTFKADKIESDYLEQTNKIEVSRKETNIQLLSELKNTLMSVDEKVLLSYSEKKELARNAITDYFNKKEEIDSSSASKYMEATDMMFNRTKELTEEKKEKETVDLTMSSSLGYFANRFGEPINKDASGNPKPFIGDINETLSKQFGYLVDSRGNKILDGQGQSVKFRDPALSSVSQALTNFMSGNTTSYDVEALDGVLGTNPAIEGVLKPGTYYSAQFKNKDGSPMGYQCAEYLNDHFYKDGRMIGSELAKKKSLVNQYGGKKENTIPKVGDTVVFDMGTQWGHVAIINSISADGSIRISQANYPKSGQVSHDMIIKPGDRLYKQIYGYASIPLKDNIASKYIPLANKTEKTDIKASMPKTIEGNTSSEGGGDIDSSSISYPGRPKPSPWASKYSNAIATDEYGNTRINWSALPKDMKSNTVEKVKASSAVTMQQAEDLLNMYHQAGVDIGAANDALAGLKNDLTLTPDTLSKLVTQNVISEQQADIIAAQGRWLEASLRDKSGAAISVGEYLSDAANNFGGPKSSPQRIENLRSNRQSQTSLKVNSAGNASIIYDAYLGAPSTIKPLTSTESTKTSANKAVDDFNNTANNAVNQAGNLAQQGWNAFSSLFGSQPAAPQVSTWDDINLD